MPLPSGEKFEEFADYFQGQFFEVYEQILEKIGKRIAAIGRLTPSDAHRLNQLAAYGADTTAIEKIIQRESKKTVKELRKIFAAIAGDGYKYAEQFYSAQGVQQLPLAENVRLQQIVNGIFDATAGLFDNLSGTTTVGVVNRRGLFVPLRERYLQLIDNAVYQVSTGVTDYNAAMRQDLRDLMQSGIRVRYESGHTRELYSAVRMNVLDGCNQVLIRTQEQCGEEYGADGVEISAHGLCAPDHLPIQGRQFSREAYERLNAQLERPIGLMNCHHFAFPIVLGVSTPAYSPEQLKEIAAYSNAPVSSAGREYTRYSASQHMRQYEARLRKKKANKALLDGMGAQEEAAVLQKQIRQLSLEYRDFCADVELKPHTQRTRLPKI